jgi:phosphate transport system substrate-binding protein
MKIKENQMFKKLSFALIAVLALSFVLSACGPAATPQTMVQTQIVEVTSTPRPIAPATPTPLPAGSVQINGAGATFPLPVYTQWTYAFQYVDPSVVINYQGVGSGAGKTAILDNTVDFAGSDSLLNADQYTQGVDLQMYPMLAGAVVNIYNIRWAK